MKCEACRALDAKDVRPRIERIEEENSVSPPSEPQPDPNTPTQPSTSYPLLTTNLDPSPHSAATDPTAESLALQLDGINLAPPNNGNSSLSPKRSFYLPAQNFTLTPSVKLSQSSVDNFSQHSSLENLKSNLSANVDLGLTPKKANSEAAEEDADSVKSCQNCRQQKQSYFDEEFVGSGAKLSWQIWRDSTPENKFDYENRFK